MSAIVSDRALAAGELRLSPIAHGRYIWTSREVFTPPKQGAILFSVSIQHAFWMSF